MNDEGERREGRGKFLYFSIMSVMQWFEGSGGATKERAGATTPQLF